MFTWYRCMRWILPVKLSAKRTALIRELFSKTGSSRSCRFMCCPACPPDVSTDAVLQKQPEYGRLVLIPAMNHLHSNGFFMYQQVLLSRNCAFRPQNAFNFFCYGSFFQNKQRLFLMQLYWLVFITERVFTARYELGLYIYFRLVLIFRGD